MMAGDDADPSQYLKEGELVERSDDEEETGPETEAEPSAESESGR